MSPSDQPPSDQPSGSGTPPPDSGGTAPDNAAAPESNAAGEPEITEPVGEIIDAQLVPPPSGASENPTVTVPADYTDSGVPTYDYVRDKIEHRINSAVGSQELAESTPEGREVDEMMRRRDEAAKRKLDEIRKSMGR